jgi:D-glucosaminate-6-phosphate ammonia-lyase
MDSGSSRRNENVYLRLGVRPFINCCSVRTIHGGSLMLPEVRAAMNEAAKQFVNVPELIEAVGPRLGELTGNEWGLVTCGSAAAIALATAGCVAGNDPEKMLRLPFTDGMKNKVIVPKGQRFAYDQAIRMVGVHIIEPNSRAELVRMLESKPVAMICILGTHEEKTPLRMAEIVPEARRFGVPILVDAASEHIEKPSPWIVKGANMVIYSGGKFLRGPQTTGLLLGEERLVRAAWANASPHQALGRPMKVSKEDIVGLVAAVEYWFGERDKSAEDRRWRGDLAAIAKPIQARGIGTEILEPRGVDRVPRLRVRWASSVGLTGLELRNRLLQGEPRVMVDDMDATENSIVLDPFGLESGEAQLVGRRIAEELAAAVSPKPVVAGRPTASVAGRWRVKIMFQHGESEHELRLEQSGAVLGGNHRTLYLEGPVQGAIEDGEIRFTSELLHEGSRVNYEFSGRVAGSAMTGSVLLGGANASHLGPVNMRQFGEARWSAERVPS